jgi:hypothetical protein
VQDQPVVSIAAEGLGHDPFELRFDLIDILARREAGSVADPEDVRVDGERLLPKRGVENDVGRFAAYSRKFLELFPRPRNLAAMLVDQRLAEGEDVLGFGVEQADRLDRFAQLLLAQFDHVAWRFYVLKQRLGRDIDARVRGLRGEHDGDEQLKGIGRFELGRRRRILLREPPKKFENFVALHSDSITSRME